MSNSKTFRTDIWKIIACISSQARKTKSSICKFSISIIARSKTFFKRYFFLYSEFEFTYSKFWYAKIPQTHWKSNLKDWLANFGNAHESFRFLNFQTNYFGLPSHSRGVRKTKDINNQVHQNPLKQKGKGIWEHFQ